MNMNNWFHYTRGYNDGCDDTAVRSADRAEAEESEGLVGRRIKAIVGGVTAILVICGISSIVFTNGEVVKKKDPTQSTKPEDDLSRVLRPVVPATPNDSNSHFVGVHAPPGVKPIPDTRSDALQFDASSPSVPIDGSEEPDGLSPIDWDSNASDSPSS